MKKLRLAAIGIGASLALSLGAPRPAQAEPYLSVRNGMKCSLCHVNRTGGGMRTDLFKLGAAGFLKYPRGWFADSGDAGERFSGKLPGGVSVGADFRAENVSLFQDEPDGAGRVPSNRITRPYQANDFEIGEAVGYFKFDLLPERLVFYAAESFAPGGAANREAFALFPVSLAGGGHVKVGQFYPSYGLRLQDDGAFIRSRTDFNFDNPDQGLELGIEAGSASAVVSVTNGGSDPGGGRAKRYAANVAYLRPGVPLLHTVLVGGSVARNDLSRQTFYGAYVGTSPWRLTLLAEADFIRDEAESGKPVDRAAAHAEVDWLVVDWLNARLAYDYYDPDRDVKQDHQDRFTLGLEPFLSRFLQIRLSYVVANGIPQRPQDSSAELRAEVHLFF